MVRHFPILERQKYRNKKRKMKREREMKKLQKNNENKERKSKIWQIRTPVCLNWIFPCKCFSLFEIGWSILLFFSSNKTKIIILFDNFWFELKKVICHSTQNFFITQFTNTFKSILEFPFSSAVTFGG